MSDARALLSRAENKLSRLSRIDENGLGLATNDPLLCEVMMANALSSMAIAQATLEQNERLKELEVAVRASQHEPFYARTTSYGNRAQIAPPVLFSIENILRDILEVLKSLVKAVKRS